MLISLTTPAASFVKVFSTRMIPSLLGILIVQVLASLYKWFNNSLYIKIAEGEITGSKMGLFRGSLRIYLKDLARTSLLKKSTYQKFFASHKLCSTRGEIIMFAPFVYEKSIVEEFYKALEIIQNENLKDKKRRL